MGETESSSESEYSEGEHTESEYSDSEHSDSEHQCVQVSRRVQRCMWSPDFA